MEYIYTDSKGNEFQLHQLTNSHLVNALLKMQSKLAIVEIGASVDAVSSTELKRAVDAMKEEVFHRMPARNAVSSS